MAIRSFAFLFAVLLAAICPACDDKPASDDEPRTEQAAELVDATPRGVPRPADTFGAVAVDIDRVVLTARTPIGAFAPDTEAGTAGATGDEAHPETWETTDPDWIASFIDAVGPETQRIEKPPTDCRPWADLTLYSDQTASASFAVACPRDRFTTLVTRPSTHIFVAKDKETMARLLQEIRGQ